MKADIFGIQVESVNGRNLTSGFEVEPFWNAARKSLERYEYHPNPWHRMKAVVDELGGEMITPEPEVESKPGVVY